MIVLDTNVISELMRDRPSEKVMGWVANQPLSSLFTTSISQSEIYHGIYLLPSGKRRKALEQAAQAMFSEDFRGRILSFSSEVTLPYAQISVDRRRSGRPISGFDAQIAAIAACHGAKLATRNVADFERCGIDVIDPWNA